MAMKPSLALSQQLTMTPQLLRAVRLLQLSQLELQAEIQEALASNVMLEEIEEHDFEDDGEAEAAAQKDPADSGVDGEEVPDTYDEMLSESLTDDFPVDCVWEDTWDESGWTTGRVSDDESRCFLDSREGEALTLQGHLTGQLRLLNLSERDRLIAAAIIDALDSNGMLSQSLAEICQGLTGSRDPVELDEAEAVLHLVQHLDPLGAAARSLKECLLIQLRQLDPETPRLGQAIDLVTHHLDCLTNRNYSLLMRSSGLTKPALEAVLQLIRSLNPRPGAALAGPAPDYVEPDVLVSRQEGRWRVELNPNLTPKIRINPGYACLVKPADNSRDNTYMKKELEEARWLVRSLRQRNETLARVATCIVEFQKDFFTKGPEAMKPLVLRDVAEATGLHDSTVSRVIAHKYMHTPLGLFEFRHFFSSHVSTDSGDTVSSTAIRAHIKKLVTEENPVKPLSDNRIALLLQDQGIQVARRTVAKYREQMMIPPSNERKELSQSL